MHRLFVAIPLPEPIIDQLLDLEINMIGARWMPIGSLHLTLAFIGDVTDEKLGEVISCLDEVEVGEFELELKGVGHFGSKARPRIIWCGVKDSDELRLLQSRVAAKLREIGIELDRRRYVPHITLARLSGAKYRDVGRFIEQYSLFESGSFDVKDFSLYCSRLSKSGAEYTVVESYSLK